MATPIEPRGCSCNGKKCLGFGCIHTSQLPTQGSTPVESADSRASGSNKPCGTICRRDGFCPTGVCLEADSPEAVAPSPVAWLDSENDRVVTARQMHSMQNHQGAPGKAASRTYSIALYPSSASGRSLLTDERERFEAWAVPFGLNTMHHDNFADYADVRTWMAWKAWQAAIESAVLSMQDGDKKG